MRFGPARRVGNANGNDYELIPEEFVDIGDRVVVTVRLRAHGRRSGIEVDARLYDVFTVRDGKIVRMDQSSAPKPSRLLRSEQEWLLAATRANARDARF